MSSPLGWTILKSGWPVWKDAAAAAGLRDDPAGADEGRFRRALILESIRRSREFIDGILAYRHAPRPSTAPYGNPLWQEGSSVLIDTGGAGGVPALIVPSLVNRWHILDLMGDGFLTFLKGHGVHPLLLDWREPGEGERRYGLDAYITRRIEPALEHACRFFGRPPVLLGYCMGGNLALAAAIRAPERVHSLAILAAPWDFHLSDQGIDWNRARHLVEQSAKLFATIPVDILQMFFFSLDPLGAARKFSALADRKGKERERFIALEDWLNDGVELSAPLARQCLERWYRRNDPGRGRWRVAGKRIDPSAWRKPALVVVPGQDRIVDPSSALALARALPSADVLRPNLGHVGLMASPRARQEVWGEIRDWMTALA